MPEPTDGWLDAVDAAEMDRPTAARMYDYFLGGAANFAVDREAAEQILAVYPAMRPWARANRAFLRRSVTYLCDQGVDQFLDLGSGIPTVGNVHEIAHRYNPEARVAYVDIEPVAVAHTRQMLAGVEHVSVTQEDIRRPDRVLAAPGVAGLLDFDRPVAVLAYAILHALGDDDQPGAVLAAYRDACVPGSYLAVSHPVVTSLGPGEVDQLLEVYRKTPTPATVRTVDEVRALLDGYEPVKPGLVLLDHWRPEYPVSDEDAARTNCYATVARLPERT